MDFLEDLLSYHKKRTEYLENFKSTSMGLNDFEKALEAVKINGFCLGYLSEELKNNKEIIAAALKDNPEAYRFAGEEFKQNKKHFKQLIEYFNEKTIIFEYCPHEFKKDKELCMFAISKNPKNMAFIDKELWQDFDIILLGLNSGYNFKDYPNDIKDNEEIIFNLYKSLPETIKTPKSIYFVHDSLMQNLSYRLKSKLGFTSKSDSEQIFSNLESLINKKRLEADLPNKNNKKTVKI